MHPLEDTTPIKVRFPIWDLALQPLGGAERRAAYETLGPDISTSFLRHDIPLFPRLAGILAPSILKWGCYPALFTAVAQH